MSLTKAEEKRFFAKKPNKRHRVSMGGKKLALANMPKEIQDKVLSRLAEKDEVMARGLAGELPGLKIDGKQVTKDNIHEFEIDFKKPKKVKEVKKESVSYSRKELEAMSFFKLKRVAKKLGETGRSSEGLIKDILKHQ